MILTVLTRGTWCVQDMGHVTVGSATVELDGVARIAAVRYQMPCAGHLKMERFAPVTVFVNVEHASVRCRTVEFCVVSVW